MNWEPLNLASEEFAIPSEPPGLCGLIYAGKRHVVSGPPEALKTLLTLILALEHMRAGGTIAFVDFESGPAETRRLLEDLGASSEEIGRVIYFEPDGPPATDDVERIVGEGVTLVVIDAAAGAYDVSLLDDNKRVDAERFAATWIRPLWQRGVTTIVIDHVTKNSETRGKFSIGSERKLGQADVHLGLHAVKQLSRGTSGLVTVMTHKDRPGHLTRPKAAEIELRSDPESHRITWEVRPAETENESGWRPTVLMQRVSEFLERQAEPVSRKAVEQHVNGRAQYVRDALDCLIVEAYASETTGPHSARLVSSLKPYIDTSSHLVPSSSGTNSTSSSLVPPLKGDEDEDDIDGTNSTSSSHEDEVDIDELERLHLVHADIAGKTT
ncbi:MAG: AAA family ATPase [Gaiellaceae bacterium]